MSQEINPQTSLVWQELEDIAQRILFDKHDELALQVHELIEYGNRCYEMGRREENPRQHMPSVNEYQIGGSHYKMTIEPWDAIHAWGLGYFDGNAVKYLSRAGRKGPRLTDLLKAKHYIDKAIELEERS